MSQTPTQSPVQTPPQTATGGPATTRYALLLHEDERVWAGAGPEVWAASMEAHGRFARAVVESGATIVGGEVLTPTAAATTVRGDLVTDGPFAETKEAFGGFYLIDARDLDHALSLAKQCPMGSGCVEVRPVLDIPGTGTSA